MPVDEYIRERVDAFRDYIEDLVAADDRYGPAHRCEADDDSIISIRFEAGPASYFEVAVCTVALQVRVGFASNDPETAGEIEQSIQESEESVEALVASGFRDAGLEWDGAPVQRHTEEGGLLCFSTPLDLDEVPDVDRPEVRDKTLRMLEGYFIAFGPGIEHEAEDEDEDEDY